MLYLANASSERVRDAMRTGELGMMCTDAEGRVPLTAHGGELVWFAADNGCYAARGNLDVDRWLTWLTALVAGREHRCLFAVAPDVFNPDLGDAMGSVSLAYSRQYLCDVRALGVPVALVAQNGLTPDMVPWDEIDWIFLGGTTEWKLSTAAEVLSREATAHGKCVHMGRVNSAIRWAVAREFECATVDGTFLANGPDKNLERMRQWWTPGVDRLKVRRYLRRKYSRWAQGSLFAGGDAA